MCECFKIQPLTFTHLVCFSESLTRFHEFMNVSLAGQEYYQVLDMPYTPMCVCNTPLPSLSKLRCRGRVDEVVSLGGWAMLGVEG